MLRFTQHDRITLKYVQDYLCEIAVFLKIQPQS